MRSILAVLLAVSLLVPSKPAPKGYIALTFDDGPSGKITSRLLEGLEERDVKATFFLCCYRMEQYPETLTKIVEGGHEIGLHSCSHRFMDKLAAEEIRADMEACTTVLEEYTGLTTDLYRPPGGLYNQALLEEAERAGFSIILWSVDAQDWDPNNTQNVLPYLKQHTGPGDVVLLHDLYQNSVDAALALIDHLRLQGYEFCTVSELAARHGVTLEPGTVYRRFASQQSQ